MDKILIGIIALLIVIVISQYSGRKKLVQSHEKEKNELGNKINLISNESHKELTATLTKKHYTMEQKKQEELQNLKNHYDVELTKMRNYISNLESYSRNRGEIIAHKILIDLKNDLVNTGVINRNEMIIMGNVFIPFRYKEDDDLKSRQIDHLILLPHGIYIIETKYWKGRILQGITKRNSGKLSLLMDNIFPKIADNEEKTLVLNPAKQNDNKNYEFRVVSYENPEKQVRQTAVKFNSFIKENINKNIFVKTMVYFGYPQNKENYVENFSQPRENYPTLICSGEEDLKKTLISEIINSKKQFSIEDLMEVQELLNEYNRIS